MKSTASKSLASAPAAKVVRVPTELRILAQSFYEANKTANLMAAQARKAKEELYARMKDAGLDQFDFPAEVDSGRVILHAEVGPGRASTHIDIMRLRQLVPEGIFLRTVSATCKDVESHCGGEVLSQVKRTEPGAETVSVAPKK